MVTFSDCNETSSSVTVLNDFLIMYESISSIDQFFFFRLLYLSTRFHCLLNCLTLYSFWIFSYLPTCFWVMLFRILGMLVQLNKAAFPLHKALISLVKSWLWDECLLPCKRLSLHREKHDIYMLNYMFACFRHYYFL